MNTIARFRASGSHQEVGLAIGRRFGDQIQRLFENYDFLQQRLLPFHRSPSGRDLYIAFLELQKRNFPGYVAELEGMAQGAERPFEELFLVNLRGEYGGLMALERTTGDTAGGGRCGCTDCLVMTSGAALVGHNEDGTPAALGDMFLVHVQVGEQPGFSALCYPGFLPGNACGFNASGVLHTVDAVSPRQVRIGLARHFLARSLLDASSLSDAINRVTVAGRAAGFTYNIGSIFERRLVSVEVSPDRLYVHEIQGHYVHTNHYLNLRDVSQTIGPSSQARCTRARALCQATPPTRAADVLSLLGDEADCDYPIFRIATPPDRSATLCTALFDLDNRQLRVYPDHPIRAPERCIVVDLWPEEP
jgi:hypothetical protein